MQCECCGKETTNKRFCSRSCSAKVTNREVIKRKADIVWACKSCGILCGYRNKFCDACRIPDYTKDEVDAKQNVYSSKYALVRSKVYKITRNRKQECVNCGYDKHVEICHIKAVKDFEGSSRISEINAPDNLILLCPNCHWEFDSGVLPIETLYQNIIGL